MKKLSLYELNELGGFIRRLDDDSSGGSRDKEGKPEGNAGKEDGDEKKDDKKEEEEEEEWMKEETEEERQARKEREEEEAREYEEELRRDKKMRSKMDKLSLKGSQTDEAICCSGICGKTSRFHPCACLAPVRQDPIPYDAMLEKRKTEHPEWYVDPYGLDDDDPAGKVMRMLMGEVSEEEANQMLENLMTEEEKKEENLEELESPRGSEPEPLSRTSSPGSFDFFGKSEDGEGDSLWSEEDEEYRWPTCREWTIELGQNAIQDFIETRWNLPNHYKFCVDFLGSVTGPPEQYVEDYYFRAKFSVPTRLEPIPLQRAAVHFLVSVMLHHDRPKMEKVYVAYYLESKRTRLSAETPFKLEWLQRIMENKHRLADDWGHEKTNLYQYVLDGPESRKKKESLPLSSTDSQGFWIPNY